MNSTNQGPPAEPLTRTLPSPIVDRSANAFCTAKELALNPIGAVVSPPNVRTNSPPVK